MRTSSYGVTWVCSFVYVMFDSQNGYALSKVTLQSVYGDSFHILLKDEKLSSILVFPQICSHDEQRA